MDWNEDGMKDLICGERDGHIRIYLNINTDADPQFNGYTYLQMGGIDYLPDFTVVPLIVDWNEDGKKDMLVGTDVGYIELLINEGSNAAPIYNAATRLQESGADLLLYPFSRSAPVMVDWNRDGMKDLIVGTSMGKLYYFENTGSHASPAFDGHEPLKAGGEEILVGLGYARPWPVDWDEDGLVDLLAGSWNAGYPAPGYLFVYLSFDPMTANSTSISAGTGGSVTFYLEAGPNNLNRNYIVLSGVTGTIPGTLLPGGYATLPINWDPFTDFMMLFLNTPLCVDFMGKLDGNGLAKAQLNSPPLPSTAVGVTMYYAFTMNNPFDFASNPVEVKILP